MHCYMKKNTSLRISAIFLLDSFQYHLMYCTVVPCFVSNPSTCKIRCNLLYILFQMLEMCRGREDRHSTTMTVCDRDVLVQLSIRKITHHIPKTAAAGTM